jgi:antitoxin (DNA-binding transcriptional repressor) of toxin-antitoxin stability system
MDALKVGIRELRADLPKFLLETGRPLAVTRHGETVGYYIPTRKRVSDADAEALREAARTMDALLSSSGLNEEALAAEFEVLRKAKRAATESS